MHRARPDAGDAADRRIKKVCNAFDEGVYEAINLEKCVRDRKVKGAPCPENVRAAAKEVRTIVNGL